MGTWRKMSKADHNSNYKTHWESLRHHQNTGIPRWERGEKWAKQITTATKTHWESLRYHQNTGIPRWQRGEKWAKQITTASKTHWESLITKTLGFPDGNVEKNEQSRSQQQLKHIEKHWDTTKTLGFPDGDVEKKWAKQITTAIKTHWESLRYHQNTGIPRWERGEK